MTTCPSGVHYMHLVDHARAHIEQTYRRPWPTGSCARARARPAAARLFRAGAAAWRGSREPFGPCCRHGASGLALWRPRACRAVARWTGRRSSRPRARAAAASRCSTGCAQQVLAPEINEATIRLLTRHGCEVVSPRAPAAAARSSITWARTSGRPRARQYRGLDRARSTRAVSTPSSSTPRAAARRSRITASCCATTRPGGEGAKRLRAGARHHRIHGEIGLQPPSNPSRAGASPITAACSLQHGQKIARSRRSCWRAAGFTVLETPEGHLCCGSAGTYNLLQPEIAEQLRDRKVANIEARARI